MHDLFHPTHLHAKPCVDTALQNTYHYPATSNNLALAHDTGTGTAPGAHDTGHAAMQHCARAMLLCNTHDAMQHCCGAASLLRCSTQAPPG